MNRAEFDIALEELRNHAADARLERESNGHAVPLWVEKFEAIDLAMQNYGDLPGDWNLHYAAYL